MKFATEVLALVALLSSIPQYACYNHSETSHGSHLMIIPYQSANCTDGNSHLDGHRAHPKDYGAHGQGHGHLREGHGPPPHGNGPAPPGHSPHPPQPSGSPGKEHHPPNRGIVVPHNTCVGFPMAKSYRAVQVTHPGDPFCQLSIFTGAGCTNDMRTIKELGGTETCFDTNLPYGWLGGGNEASWSAYYYCDGTTK